VSKEEDSIKVDEKPKVEEKVEVKPKNEFKIDEKPEKMEKEA